MRKIFCFISIFLTIVITITSCQWETPVPDDTLLNDGICRNLKTFSIGVSAKSEGDVQGTKSLVEIDKVERFHDAFLFCMNPGNDGVITDDDVIWKDENNVGIYKYTTSVSFNWDLPVDTPFVIFTLVNTGNLDSDTWNTIDSQASDGTLTVADLNDLIFVCDNIYTVKELENDDKGLPQSGITDVITQSSNDNTISVDVANLFAKFDFWIRTESLVEAGYSNLKGEYLKVYSNSKCPYFVNNYSVPHTSAGKEQIKFLDLATETDIEEIENWSAGHVISFYVLENCQGNNNGNDAWYHKNNITNKDYKSRIEFCISATKDDKAKDCFFTLFLGNQTNACVNNFDVVRNYYKTLRVSLTPSMIENNATDGIYFTNDADLCLAPGESINIPFEYSVDFSSITSQVFKSDGVTPASDIIFGHDITIGHNEKRSGDTYVYDNLNYFSSAKFNPRADCETGDYIYRLSSGDYFTEVTISVNESSSLFSDIELLHKPQYKGEWGAIRIPSKYYNGSLSGDDDFVSLDIVCIGYYYDSSTHSYKTRSSSYGQSISFDNGSNVYIKDSDYKNVNKTHLFFDKTNNILFYYTPFASNITNGYPDKYEIRISGYFEDSTSGESYSVDYKSCIISGLKVPLLKPDIYEYKSNNTYEYNISFTDDHHVFRPNDISFCLIDPETHNILQQERYFDWARCYEGDNISGYTGYSYTEISSLWNENSIPGSGFYRDNLALRTMFNYDITESELEDYFVFHNLDGTPDMGDVYNMRNICNFYITPNIYENYSNEDDYSIYIDLPFFNRGIDIIPRMVNVGGTYKQLNVYPAFGNTMSGLTPNLSSSLDDEDFYLMYGIKKSFFINTIHLGSVTPTVTLSASSDEAPYLQYYISDLGDLNNDGTLWYRCDFWVDRYEKPLDYDDTAMPYYGSSIPFDSHSGDKTVDITIEVYGLERTLHANVLHSRFGADWNYTIGELELGCNPFSFDISFNCSVDSYQKQVIWDQSEYSWITEYGEFCFTTFNESLLDDLKAPFYGVSAVMYEEISNTNEVFGLFDISGKTFPYNAKYRNVHCGSEIGVGYYLLDDRVLQFFRNVHQNFVKEVAYPVAVVIPNEVLSANATFGISVNGLIGNDGYTLTGDVVDLKNYFAVKTSGTFGYVDSGAYECLLQIGQDFWQPHSMSRDYILMMIMAADNKNNFNSVVPYADVILTYENMKYPTNNAILRTFSNYTGKFAFQKWNNPNPLPLYNACNGSDSVTYITDEEYRQALSTPVQFRDPKSNFVIMPLHYEYESDYSKHGYNSDNPNILE